MLTLPSYDIHCDEPGCRNVASFLLSQTEFPHVYEIHASDEVYAHHGGETLPDGKHRCSACRAKLNPPPPEPHEIVQRLDRIRLTPSIADSAKLLVSRARDYRQMEQDGTPRLWRGKQLQERAEALDDAIDSFVEASNGR